MTLDHEFYVVVGKQCRTENAYAGHQHNIFIYESNQDKKSKNLDDLFLLQNRLESLIWVIRRFPKNILFFFLVSNFCFRAF